MGALDMAYKAMFIKVCVCGAERMCVCVCAQRLLSHVLSPARAAAASSLCRWFYCQAPLVFFLFGAVSSSELD